MSVRDNGVAFLRRNAATDHRAKRRLQQAGPPARPNPRLAPCEQPASLPGRRVPPHRTSQNRADKLSVSAFHGIDPQVLSRSRPLRRDGCYASKYGSAATSRLAGPIPVTGVSHDVSTQFAAKLPRSGVLGRESTKRSNDLSCQLHAAEEELTLSYSEMAFRALSISYKYAIGCF